MPEGKSRSGSNFSLEGQNQGLCITALAGVAQFVGALSREPKGRGFDPWSVHIPRLPGLVPVGAHTRGS